MASKEKETDKAEAAAAPAGGGKKKMLFLVGLGLLLVGISVGGTFAVLKMMAPPAKEESHEAAAEGEHGKEGEHAKHITYIDMKPAFVVNFQAGNRTHYLQLELSLMTLDAAAAEEMQVHLPLVRNSILMVLNQQDFGSLQTPEGKDTLRAAILEKVRALLEQELKKPVVEKVFFTAFVMQ